LCRSGPVDPQLGPGAADRALDRITLIVSGFLLIGMIPLAFAVMVIVGGP
jgi:hypothetical protein